MTEIRIEALGQTATHASCVTCQIDKWLDADGQCEECAASWRHVRINFGYTITKPAASTLFELMAGGDDEPKD